MSALTAEVRRRRAMTIMVTAFVMCVGYKARPGFRQDGCGPQKTTLSASNNAPEPFGDLRDHVAEQQQRRRPDERRYPIGDLKAPIRHFEYPGHQRHRGPQRSEKSPDENARYAPGFHK